MKRILLTILIIMFVNGCKDQLSPEGSKKPQTNPSSQITFDTIIYDHHLTNRKTKERNEKFKTLAKSIIIDSLKSFCKLQDLKIIESNKLPFNVPEEIGEYYENNMPRSVYEMIFPKEEIKTDRMIKTNPIIDNKKKRIIINKGPIIKEERTYKTLLSLQEKETYLQLLMTTQGKYTPDIELVTVSKDHLKLIDKLSLKGGIYDSYSVDYWHSEFSDDYENFKMTKVKNQKFEEIDLDTTYISYTFSAEGKILKN